MFVFNIYGLCCPVWCHYMQIKLNTICGCVFCMKSALYWIYLGFIIILRYQWSLQGIHTKHSIWNKLLSMLLFEYYILFANIIMQFELICFTEASPHYFI